MNPLSRKLILIHRRGKEKMQKDLATPKEKSFQRFKTPPQIRRHPSTLNFLHVLREMLKERASRAPWSSRFTIEARDVWAWGYFDHYAVTEFGKLLNRLVRLGFMEVANGRRPRRYVAKETLIAWARICTYPKCPATCGLRGLCPYHKLGFEGEEIDD